MKPDQPERAAALLIDEDIQTLHSLGYGQELLRRMSGFSNFAISLSIICILAGCVTSFQEGFSRVGGAAIGLGWPLGCLLALIVALTMAQVASAFPTAGGLYHWGSILGGRGLGWATAWLNLAGLVTVLAAINLGTYNFVTGAFHLPTGEHETAWLVGGAAAITLSQALFNHRGIRVTALLTDFSGYWILIVAAGLTIAMLASAEGFDCGRLITFTNYSGKAGADVAPRGEHVGWLFLLGLMLPAYTVSGYDASAHTAEETIGATRHVPRGIVRSVLVSGIFGWLMMCAIVLAIPAMDDAAAQGGGAVAWTMASVLPAWLATLLLVGIAVAQYLCGLATVTSVSRMVYAFARDGGLPCSWLLRRVSPSHLTPSIAIWTSSVVALLFMLFIPYATIAAVCAIFLYLSYGLPTAAGFFAHGRTWTKMGPWHVGRWYRPLAVLAVLGCLLILVVGVQPPNEQAIWIVGGAGVLLTIVWFARERRRFQGPPQGVMILQRQKKIEAEERQSRVVERIHEESQA